jgi:hypothetical protein
VVAIIALLAALGGAVLITLANRETPMEGANRRSARRLAPTGRSRDHRRRRTNPRLVDDG